MNMTKKMIGLFCTAVLALGAFAEPTISIQRVQQRYPWNGFVDIDYTVSGVDEPANYFIKFTITTNGVSTGFAASEFLSSATLLNASNGSYRVTWDSEYEQEKFFAKNVSLKAQLMFGAGGDKSQCPYPEYMVIDLSAGSGEGATYPVTEGIYACTRLEAPALFNSDQTYKTDKLALRRIKATTFTMGSPTTEPGREPGTSFNKETQHPVTLTKDYFIGIFELTQKQWKNVMGSVPGGQSATGDALALAQVTYQDIRGSSDGCDASKLDSVADGLAGAVDATSFLGKLRDRTGIDTFDLPTDAQWENAARAKTTTSTYFGDVALDDDATLGLYCWYTKNAGGQIHEVGTRRQNWFGLYDMLGNAYEWCRDRVKAAPKDDWGTDAVTDPLRKVFSGNVAARGGSWYNDSARLRSALRAGLYGVSNAYNYYGFRLSRTLP